MSGEAVQAALVDKMAGKTLNDDQRGVVLQLMTGTDRVAGVQGRAGNPGRVVGLANDTLPRSQKSTSPYVPRADYTPPIPKWKRFDQFADVLPSNDPARTTRG